jgi:uncharacterized membrane protein HdeD (DUF308 family)
MADEPTPPTASAPAPSSTTLSTSTLHAARKLWATGFVRGALFLVIGLLMFFVPDIAFNLVKWLLIVLFALQALLFAVEAGRQSSDDRVAAIWRYALAVVAIGVAVALLVWPSVTINATLRLVALWALISGVLGIVSAIRRFRDRRPAWDWELTTAVLWLLFGIMVLSKPLEDAVAVTAALSVYLTLTGAVLLIAAWSLRVYKRDAAATGVGTPSAGSPQSGAVDPVGAHSAPTAPIPEVDPTGTSPHN